jgi:hypothetical protein
MIRSPHLLTNLVEESAAVITNPVEIEVRAAIDVGEVRIRVQSAQHRIQPVRWSAEINVSAVPTKT